MIFLTSETSKLKVIFIVILIVLYLAMPYEQESDALHAAREHRAVSRGRPQVWTGGTGLVPGK